MLFIRSGEEFGIMRSMPVRIASGNLHSKARREAMLFFSDDFRVGSEDMRSMA